MRPSYYLHNIRRNSGVSLVEYVLGLAILAIVLVGVGLFFLSQPRQLDPVFQFRAVSLAEALAEQVLAVKFDERNQPDKQLRCTANCTKEKIFGTDGKESGLSDFDDVDDFHLWCDDNAITGDMLAEQLKLTQKQLYARYTVQTCVTLNTDDPSTPYKEVIISIEDQNGADVAFTLHRYNIR